MSIVVDPLDGQRFDSRGLPEGYDPHKLYEYRFDKLKKDTVFEKFLYHYIDIDLIKSFAFAIDPLYRFKVAPGIITPANRHKYRGTASVLLQTNYTFSRDRSTWNSRVTQGGISGCYGPIVYNQPINDRQNSLKTSQVVTPDTLDDTTSRTRLMGSTQGEMKSFKSYLYSPPRRVEQRTDTSSLFIGGPNNPQCALAGGTTDTRTGGFDTYAETWSRGAVLSITDFNAIKAAEYAYNNGIISSNIVSMVKGYSPFNRDYTLFRNLAELRDLPGSVLQLKETLNNLRKLYVSMSNKSVRNLIFNFKSTAKDIPNEYLSFHFGWKQTYKDLMDLLDAPSKFAKKMNFLIARSGKPTTFRSTRNFVSGQSGVPGFTYFQSAYEIFSSIETITRVSRETELRLVINATFDFPPIDSPRFLFDTFIKRTGIQPRITDVYNLVPWTWLYDWFTGLGNYIECIDNLNHDPSLINWGVITAVSKGRYVTSRRSKTRSTNNFYLNNLDQGPGEYFVTNSHDSFLEFECRTRKNIAGTLDVNETTEPSSLTAYQTSIIGALLAQRTDFSRKNGHFNAH